MQKCRNFAFLVSLVVIGGCEKSPPTEKRFESWVGNRYLPALQMDRKLSGQPAVKIEFRQVKKREGDYLAELVFPNEQIVWLTFVPLGDKFPDKWSLTAAVIERTGESIYPTMHDAALAANIDDSPLAD